MKKKFLIGLGLTIITLALIFIPTKVSAKASNKQEENYANVVIFAHFAGDESKTDKKYFEDNRDKLIKIYNGSQGRSVTNYLKTVSYNKFHIKNIFPQDDGKKINSLELPFNKEDAYKTSIDRSIIDYVLEKVPDIKNITLDYNNDGLIDNLTIILKGGDKENQSGSGATFVNHKSHYPGDSNWSGKKIGTYNILNTYALQEKNLANGAGVVVHEFLHSLGYPDLYRNNRIRSPSIYMGYNGIS